MVAAQRRSMTTNRAAGLGPVLVLVLVLCLLIEVLSGCSPRSRLAASAPPNVTTTSHAISAVGDAVAGTFEIEQRRAVRAIHPRAVAEDEATRIFRAMHPKLTACYARRLASHPTARAYVVIDVLVGVDGRPRDVSATGGGALGRDAVDCMIGHVRKIVFAPPENGGTSRVRVPFTFRPDSSADDG